MGDFTDDAGGDGCDGRDMAGGVGDRLEIQSVARTDGAALRLVGELTLATVSEFRHHLIAAETSAPATLVIDLRDLRFVDSTGLAELVATHERSRRARRRLVVVIAPGPVERLLAITGLDRHFETTAEPPDALALQHDSPADSSNAPGAQPTVGFSPGARKAHAGAAGPGPGR